MSRRKILQVGGLAMIMVLCGLLGTSYGQGNTWAGASLARMVEAARWRVGLARINAALALNNVGYDSDIYYGYFENPVPDLTATADVPVQVLLPLSKVIVLDLFEDPQYVFYLKTEREQAWNNTFAGQLHFALNRFYVQVGGGVANVRHRLSPELDINVREISNSLRGLVLWQLSQPVSFALLYNSATFDYGEAEYGGVRLADSLNRKERTIDVATYYQPNSRVRFHIDGQYGTYGAYGVPQNTSGFNDTRSYSAFWGFEFIPREGGAGRTGGIEGSASLGYISVDVMDSAQADGSGFAGTLGLSLGIMNLTTARVFFSRGFEFSIYAGATYYFSSTYGAGITRRLSRRTSVSYEITLGRSTYPSADAGSITPEGLANRYTTHVFNVSTMLARDVTLSFIGTIGSRAMGEPPVPANRNFFGVSLFYGTPRGTFSAPISGLSR
jgi:hypothetical protein